MASLRNATMPVPVKIELDDDDSESDLECEVISTTSPVDQWHASVKRQIMNCVVNHNEKSLDDFMKIYSRSLKEIVKCFADKSSLRTKIFAHIQFFHSCYKEIQSSFVETNYFNNMVDILTIYCDLELEIVQQARKYKFGRGEYKGFIKCVALRLNYCFAKFLFNEELHYLHVLLKTSTARYTPCWQAIIHSLYLHLLTKVPARDVTDEGFVRNYLVLQRWKTVRPECEHAKMEHAVYKRFKQSSDMKLAILKRIIYFRPPSKLDILTKFFDNRQSNETAYFEYMAKRKKEKENKVHMFVHLDSDDDEVVGSNDSATNLYRDMSTLKVNELERNTSNNMSEEIVVLDDEDDDEITCVEATVCVVIDDHDYQDVESVTHMEWVRNPPSKRIRRFRRRTSTPSSPTPIINLDTIPDDPPPASPPIKITTKLDKNKNEKPIAKSTFVPDVAILLRTCEAESPSIAHNSPALTPRTEAPSTSKIIEPVSLSVEIQRPVSVASAPCACKHCPYFQKNMDHSTTTQSTESEVVSLPNKACDTRQRKVSGCDDISDTSDYESQTVTDEDMVTQSEKTTTTLEEVSAKLHITNICVTKENERKESSSTCETSTKTRPEYASIEVQTDLPLVEMEIDRGPSHAENADFGAAPAVPDISSPNDKETGSSSISGTSPKPQAEYASIEVQTDSSLGEMDSSASSGIGEILIANHREIRMQESNSIRETFPKTQHNHASIEVQTDSTLGEMNSDVSSPVGEILIANHMETEQYSDEEATNLEEAQEGLEPVVQTMDGTVMVEQAEVVEDPCIDVAEIPLPPTEPVISEQLGLELSGETEAENFPSSDEEPDDKEDDDTSSLDAEIKEMVELGERGESDDEEWVTVGSDLSETNDGELMGSTSVEEFQETSVVEAPLNAPMIVSVRSCSDADEERPKTDIRLGTDKDGNIRVVQTVLDENMLYFTDGTCVEYGNIVQKATGNYTSDGNLLFINDGGDGNQVVEMQTIMDEQVIYDNTEETYVIQAEDVSDCVDSYLLNGQYVEIVNDNPDEFYPQLEENVEVSYSKENQVAEVVEQNRNVGKDACGVDETSQTDSLIEKEAIVVEFLKLQLQSDETPTKPNCRETPKNEQVETVKALPSKRKGKKPRHVPAKRFQQNPKNNNTESKIQVSFEVATMLNLPPDKPKRAPASKAVPPVAVSPKDETNKVMFTSPTKCGPAPNMDFFSFEQSHLPEMGHITEAVLSGPVVGVHHVVNDNFNLCGYEKNNSSKPLPSFRVLLQQQNSGQKSFCHNSRSNSPIEKSPAYEEFNSTDANDFIQQSEAVSSTVVEESRVPNSKSINRPSVPVHVDKRLIPKGILSKKSSSADDEGSSDLTSADNPLKRKCNEVTTPNKRRVKINLACNSFEYIDENKPVKATTQPALFRPYLDNNCDSAPVSDNNANKNVVVANNSKTVDQGGARRKVKSREILSYGIWSLRNGRIMDRKLRRWRNDTVEVIKHCHVQTNDEKLLLLTAHVHLPFFSEAELMRKGKIFMDMEKRKMQKRYQEAYKKHNTEDTCIKEKVVYNKSETNQKVEVYTYKPTIASSTRSNNQSHSPVTNNLESGAKTASRTQHKDKFTVRNGQSSSYPAQPKKSRGRPKVVPVSQPSTSNQTSRKQVNKRTNSKKAPGATQHKLNGKVDESYISGPCRPDLSFLRKK